MADILLVGLNAKYVHSALGLRYLLANLGGLSSRADLIECSLQDRPIDVVETILAQNPRIVGFGVYIWNVRLATEVIAILRRVRPDIYVVVGGPEVSHEPHGQLIVQQAHYVIQGEGEVSFAALCTQLLADTLPSEKLIQSPPVDLATVALPYALYSDDDLLHRVFYVEVSRGCPFGCEFCLSALDETVRYFPVEPVLGALATCLQRGARHIKFVDRTFGLRESIALKVLEFLHQHYTPGLLIHMELVPAPLSPRLLALMALFPPGTLQAEVGVQSLNPLVSARIGRRQSAEAVEAAIRNLREAGVHIHADLIVGLPGESLASFGAGFDALVGFGPQEVQVGILKRLRGALIARHDEPWTMVYSPLPPYEILGNSTLNFTVLQELQRFARYWDLVVNSGRFKRTAPLIWQGGAPFAAFGQFSAWLFAKTKATHAIALKRLEHLLCDYLESVRGLSPSAIEAAITGDRQDRREIDAAPGGFWRQQRHCQ